MAFAIVVMNIVVRLANRDRKIILEEVNKLEQLNAQQVVAE